MTPPIALVPRSAFENTSAQVLDEAKASDFETVIVFGFRDGRVHIKISDLRSNLELIGALDAAKMQVWANA